MVSLIRSATTKSKRRARPELASLDGFFCAQIGVERYAEGGKDLKDEKDLWDVLVQDSHKSSFFVPYVLSCRFRTISSYPSPRTPLGRRLRLNRDQL